MSCSKFQKNLSAYIDGELDLRSKEELEKHLMICHNCQREKDRISEVIELVKSSADIDVPDGLWGRVQEKLVEIPAHSHFALFKWASIPAGAVIFAILLYFFSTTFFFNSLKTSPMPIDICLQEHLLLYSEQIIPTYVSSDLLNTEAQKTSVNSQSGNPEIDLLLEVYYENN